MCHCIIAGIGLQNRVHMSCGASVLTLLPYLIISSPWISPHGPSVYDKHGAQRVWNGTDAASQLNQA